MSSSTATKISCSQFGCSFSPVSTKSMYLSICMSHKAHQSSKILSFGDGRAPLSQTVLRAV